MLIQLQTVDRATGERKLVTQREVDPKTTEIQVHTETSRHFIMAVGPPEEMPSDDKETAK